MKTSKGFTLVELVIVIIVVGILTIVGVPTYRSYVRKSMAAEGKALVSAMATSENNYYANHQEFYPASGSISGLNNDAMLGVDSRANRYFKNYTLTAGANITNAPGYAAAPQGYHVSADVDQTTDAKLLNVQGDGDSTHPVVITVWDNDVQIE